MKRLAFVLSLIPSLALAQAPPAQPAPAPATSAQMVAMQWEAVAKQQDAYATSMKAMAGPLQNLLNEHIAQARSLDQQTKLSTYWENYAKGLEEKMKLASDSPK